MSKYFIKINFLKNIAVVSIFTMVSRLFGYIRDAVIFIFISNSSGALDAFFVAFKIPNFFRRIFGEGALSTAFIPVLSDYKNNEEKEYVRDFVSSSLTYLTIILLIITVIGVIIAPVLIYIIAPGFVNNEFGQIELSSNLLRITFPYLLFICLTAVISGILNTHEKFMIPALTPVILNIILIISVVYIAPYFSEPVYALAWGVFFSGLIQLLFQFYPLLKIKLFPRIKFNKNHPGIKKIKELMLPVIFASSVTQINLIFDTIIASFLAIGSISWLYMSERFIELPLALFGISIATVLLPKLSEHYSKSDTKSYNATLNWGIKLGILLSLPATIGLTLLAKPIIITLLQYKEFSINDVEMTSLSLIAFSLGLPGMIGTKILITNFYSRKDTKYPVRAALIAVIANFILNIVFTLYLTHIEFKGVHFGLALATTISAYINFYLLFKNSLREKILILDNDITKFLYKSLLASIVMTLFILYFDLNLLTWINSSFTSRITHLFLIVFPSVIIYFFILFVLKISPKNIF